MKISKFGFLLAISFIIPSMSQALTLGENNPYIKDLLGNWSTINCTSEVGSNYLSVSISERNIVFYEKALCTAPNCTQPGYIAYAISPEAVATGQNFGNITLSIEPDYMEIIPQTEQVAQWLTQNLLKTYGVNANFSVGVATIFDNVQEQLNLKNKTINTLRLSRNSFKITSVIDYLFSNRDVSDPLMDGCNLYRSQRR